jgi:cytochrome b pre-mRNA-processing protein 3
MFGLFGKRSDDMPARVYAEIVAQARQPALYLRHGVPDTIEGRYDMMVLHAFLVVRRLARDGQPGRDLAQQVCDRFFLEMDRALREMGVGDLTVPKRMKSIAELYAGCSSAYAAALDRRDEAGLAGALARNVYEDPTGMDARAAPLAAYVVRADDTLANAPAEQILAGPIPFPSPDAADQEAA